MSPIAFFTFGVLHEPYTHSRNMGFVPRIPGVFEDAATAPGFIALASLFNGGAAATIDDYDSGEWGPYATPRFYQGSRAGADNTLAQTLSLWQDLDSVHNFTYHASSHRAALKRRKAWFQSGAWPSYVAWWVANGVVPTWQQGCDRLEHLHDHGSTAHAFDFKHPFGPDGEPTSVTARKDSAVA